MSGAWNRRCVACQSQLSGPLLVPLADGGAFDCAGCGSWTYLPRSTAEALQSLHNRPAYFEHPYFQGRRTHERSLERRCHHAFRRIGTALDTRALASERVLDVGCDTGSFLRTAQRLYRVIPVGIDIAERAVTTATAVGIEAYPVSLENAPPHLSGFALILALDLIEHVVDPAAFLTHARERLRPGGLVYLETPNISSLVYRCGHAVLKLLAGKPDALRTRLFPAEHVQYFTDAGLRALAARCRLDVVRLDHRVLPRSDIATVLPVRLGLEALQAADALTGRGILLCAVLRRPS